MSLDDDAARERSAHHRKMLPPLALCVLATVVGYIACLAAVETVMATGPILLGLGIWLAARGMRASRPPAVLLGAGLGVLSLTLFATVNLLSWSPADAAAPFAVIGAVVGVLVVALALLALREPRPAAAPGLEALRHRADA
jgi:hypothetical protein